MATHPITKAIQHLRMTLPLHDEERLSDANLLGRFIENRDEAAFAALTRRHGPLVMGVCRRVTSNRQDAEDAFQAAFLVLARKAGSLASRALLANWLYGVAYNTALKAKALAGKRRSREKQVKEMPDPAVCESPDRTDVLRLLDQEVNNLPEKYRVPIVLCDLEGITHKKAAEQLGCPEKTLSSRLARARAMLAKQLTRSGLPVSGATLAMLLSNNAASAHVPLRVLFKTVQSAALIASGQSAGAIVSAPVAALTEGVLKAMLLRNLSIATLVMVTFFACCGIGILTRDGWAGAQSQPALARQASNQAANTQQNSAREQSNEERLQGTWKVETKT
jgi:RNA polymerase sigma factor (sigma-70 family)